MDESFISIAALEAITDVKSPHWWRQHLLWAPLKDTAYKYGNLTATYHGVDDDGYPILEMPNVGAYYKGGKRSARHEEDPWGQWVNSFEFGLLIKGSSYFFLVVEDPSRKTKKGRPIRYPVVLVEEKLPHNGTAVSRWSANHNGIFSQPAHIALDDVKERNERYLNWLVDRHQEQPQPA